MDRTEEILQELRELRKQANDTHTELCSFRAAQAQICNAASRQRDEHHRALFGNGKPGLVSAVQDLTGNVQRLETAPPAAEAAAGLSRREAYGVGAVILAAVEAAKAWLHLS